jgi:hypothetical protein
MIYSSKTMISPKWINYYLRAKHFNLYPGATIGKDHIGFYLGGLKIRKYLITKAITVALKQ